MAQARPKDARPKDARPEVTRPKLTLSGIARPRDAGLKDAGLKDAGPRPTQPPLILASASPRRLELLAGIGIIPDGIDAADIDESPYRRESPRHYVERMARQKATLVASRHGGGRDGGADEGVGDATSLVLAADTVVVAGRRLLGKPHDSIEAAAFLTLLSGRRHRVLTAVAVCRAGSDRPAIRVVESRVKFGHLEPPDIAAYIASGEWQGKAGGYAIQGVGGRFVAWLEGSYSGIVGLPLYEAANLLAGHGYTARGKACILADSEEKG